MDDLNKMSESVEFFTKIANDAFLKHVPFDVKEKLTKDEENIWKSGYMTAYIEFQKSYNISSKN